MRIHAFVVSTLLSAVSMLAAFPAQAAGDHASHASKQSGKAAPPMQMTDGEVKKIDKTSGKITLSHGALTNLDMPAMTMAFVVSNAAWLGRVKVGDKIRFMADNVNGVLTVVHLEPAK